MKMKRAYIWAYLDGKRLVEVIQAALDNNMMVDDSTMMHQAASMCLKKSDNTLNLPGISTT